MRVMTRNEMYSRCGMTSPPSRLEPMDTLSKALASTLRELPTKGHLCVA